VTTEKAQINRSRKISAIWFIPLLAAALGIYMVVHNMLTEGPEIQIAFKTASGLEQGKTKIKFRNVDMGVVDKVTLNDDLDGVIVTARLDRQALPLLRDDTRFWVVTARVGVGNVSGLDTLLSGAYIQIAPGKGKPGARVFAALEQPPLTPAGAPGLRVRLTSDKSSSITAGDAVLYNGYKVGRVETMEFDPRDRRLHYAVFIDAPYHDLVDSHTRFWDVSGVSLSAGADGFKVDTGSLDTILLGGVAFGLPPGISKGVPVEDQAQFELYTSYDDILENPFRFGAYYVVQLSQSVKGLVAGAPVEYRGIPIGRVERIMLKESMEYSAEHGTRGQGDDIPVLIYLEPGRLEMPDEESSIEEMHKAVREGVKHGMRASLETGNLLTGGKYISIDYFKDVEKAEIHEFSGYPTLPSIGTGLGRIEQKVNAALDKINALPLETTISEANNALATLNATLDSLDTLLGSEGTQQLPVHLNDTLKELRDVLKGFSENSGAYQSVNSSLLRLNRTLNNLESLTRTLSQQPNAVIFPSSPVPDPVPEVKQQ